ncbi:RNA polymerase II transcription factor B subunit 1 [Apophysomyces ossiformis]|uniref:RNA polymerase II transcription factor B subunit 1 n=1 Tax=Apophysomyces ossiformis TaxID=679940 RepID=A0A8H7ETC1_9FUNG|nr:RNA polymerase II transcription factor B subunit 1 [Apophysomyces ossiformis]
MWQPNEQLLLRASVHYKSNEGTLFVTPWRVAWQQQGSPRLNPSISYSEIASLQQTPETAEKVLLKITTQEPSNRKYTFHFTSPKALTEREAIKSQVAELFSRARGMNTPSVATSSAPMTPASSAAPSPLPTSIATPVIANGGGANGGTATPPSSTVISTPSSSSTGSPNPSSPHSWRHEEFNARKQLLSTSKELHMLHMELVVTGKNVSEEEFWSSPYVKRIRQKLKKDAVSREGRQKGKSSKMVELKPGQQEGSDVKYTLTSQIIHNIFNEFPSVKRAFDLNVPDKLSEQQFWKRFLASEFFHRSRSGGRSQLTPYDDIFDRCLQEEDDENSKAPEMIDKIKRAIDLTATQEDHIESGNSPDFTMKQNSNSHVLPLIRRFNRHAMRVLETPVQKSKGNSDEDHIEQEIIIPDLTDEPAPERIILDIQDTRRYFESQSGGKDDLNVTEETAKQLLNEFKAQFQAWQPELTRHVMRPKVADKVCHDLTMTIKRKIRHDQRANASEVKLPTALQQKIQSYHSATNEILRHFWSSFEPYRAEKNARMTEGLKKQQERLKGILVTVNSHKGDVSHCEQMLLPVMSAVDRALEASRKRAKRKR